MLCTYTHKITSVYVTKTTYLQYIGLHTYFLEGRFTEYLVESILTILCTTIGCFLTVVCVLRRRNQHNMHDLRHTTSKLTNAGGLCLSIVGGMIMPNKNVKMSVSIQSLVVWFQLAKPMACMRPLEVIWY